VITSANAVNVAENTTSVLTVTATDPDLPAETLTYFITGGDDAPLFAINSSSGELTFVSGRDHEFPSDANVDGIYEVAVRVSDGTNSDTQDIRVTVGDLNEAPMATNPSFADDGNVFTSNGGGIPNEKDAENSLAGDPVQNDPIQIKENLKPGITADNGLSLVVMTEQDPGAMDIVYFTEPNHINGHFKERSAAVGSVHLNGAIYREIASEKYLWFPYRVSENAIRPKDVDAFGDIDLNDTALDMMERNTDYERLRGELDEAFHSQLQSRSAKTTLLTLTAATFTAGIVSYLLRIGSLVASMMSTLPLWRGFDPIAILARSKKEKKRKKDALDNAGQSSENLFDGGTS
jgi:hypothetical protein